MTVSRRAWEKYPQTYRAREMEILADWIRAGESSSIVGLAGAGKSNLLGFLCSQPQVITERYLQDSSLKLALVLVDLNNLPSNDLATFYRVVLRSLNEARAQLADIEKSLSDAVHDLYHKVEEKTDPFVSQSALREVLLSFRENKVRLVLVLDPFDQFCRAVTTQILDNLRGLRDSFKTTLSYIVGLRRELTYLRDPVELGELYEILDTHVCWLGPMQREDARWVISQVEGGMEQSFNNEQVEWLIDLTGGYPALLRVASLWLAQSLTISDMALWEKRLLDEPSIQIRLNDLWQGLTSEEQAALAVLQTVLKIKADDKRREGLRQVGEKYRHTFDRLQSKQLCNITDANLEIFSSLFAQFIAGVTGVGAGKIRHDPSTERFFRGDQELENLSELDYKLLYYFFSNPCECHSIDILAEAIWIDDDIGEIDNQQVGQDIVDLRRRGVSSETVQQAIRHLRTRIEPNPAKPCYLVTQRGRGYRFFPEGMPQK